VGVDPDFDSKQQLWCSLYLVDNHHAVEGDEADGVLERRLPILRKIEIPPLRGSLTSYRAYQGALTRLPSAVDEDDPSVIQRFRDREGGMTRHELGLSHT
jgi:hypothetical protein